MKNLTLINIGYGNYAAREKVVLVLKPDSAPVRRMTANAREEGKLIDASSGKKTRSVLIMDNGNVVLSALASETMAEKFHEKRNID